MEKIERVEVDLLRIGKQMYKFRSGFGGGVCSDEEWLWCSCLGNLETYFVHQNWIRHTRLDKLLMPRHWFFLRQENRSWTTSGPRTVPSTDQVWAVWKVSRSVLSDSLRPHGLYSLWNSPGQNTGVGSRSFLQGIFPTQGLNPGLTLQADSFLSEPPGKPKNTGVGSLSLLQRIFPTQESNGVSCNEGGFFTNWAIREAYYCPEFAQIHVH